MVSALDSASQLTAQAPDPLPRIRDSFDFGWRFCKGDAPGCAGAGLRGRELAHSRPAARLERRRPVLAERAERRRRRLRSHRHRLVSEALPRAGVVPGPQGFHRVRRRLPEQRSVDQRAVSRQAALRVHQLRLRPHSPLKLERRERRRRKSGQFAPAEFALVLRLGHLPAYLADGRESGPCGAVGNVCHHPEGLQRCRDGSREDSGAEREGGSSGLYADHGAGRSARQNNPDGGGVAGHRRQRRSTSSRSS